MQKEFRNRLDYTVSLLQGPPDLVWVHSPNVKASLLGVSLHRKLRAHNIQIASQLIPKSFQDGDL